MRRRLFTFFCSIILLISFSTSLVSAQEEVSINVVDSLTGDDAEGVTIKVFNENNTLVWTSKEGGNVSLNTGEYNIRVELELFGKMIPLNNQPIDVELNNTNEFIIYLSFVFIPIKYIPYLIYAIVGLLILTVTSSVFRRIRKRRKAKLEANELTSLQNNDLERIAPEQAGAIQQTSISSPQMDIPDIDYDPALMELDYRDDWWVFPSGSTIALDGRMPISEAWEAMSERGIEKDTTVLIYNHERGRIAGYITHDVFHKELSKVKGIGGAGVIGDIMDFKDLLDM